MLSQDLARTILGENFFGSRELKKAFGSRLDGRLIKIPNINISESDLWSAKEENKYLILRINRLQNKELTIKNLVAIFDKMPVINSCVKQYYFKKFFYNCQTPLFGWHLVSKILPGSINKNLLEQLLLLNDAADRYSWRQLVGKKELLQKIIQVEFARAAFILRRLKIIKYLPTPVELVYDSIVHFLVAEKNVLENECVWARGVIDIDCMPLMGYGFQGKILMDTSEPFFYDSDLGLLIQKRI